MINIDGLVTGIDTEAVIQGLLQIQQQQIDRITARKTLAQQRRAAFQSLEAQVLALRTQAGKLARTQNSPFQARSASVSVESALIATAQPNAAPGVYEVRVNALARAHQVASQGFSDRQSPITQGTLTLRVGNRPPVTITIDESNNTLQGLADALNASGAGVSAAIVQDGTGSTPYRLLLTSRTTGTAGAISLENNLAPSGGGAVQPSFDFDNPVQAAANASTTLGSGPGAITVESASNEVKGLIDGVTLNLLQADPARAITVRVEADVAAGTAAVQDFVDAFNSTLDFIANLTKFDAATGQSGLLLGDRTVIDIQQQLRAAVLDVVPGVSLRANRLTAIGISVNDQGRLTLNASRLQDILNGRVDGVTANDLQKLFALDGTSTHPAVSFVLGSTRTEARAAPYQVDVTQAAERAAVTAASPLAPSVTIDGTNDTLQLTLDGAAVEVALAHGDYTPQQLADLLETTINAHPSLVGRQIAASLTAGDELVLTSLSYGSSSQVTINGGSLVTTLGLAVGQSDAGVDVAGTFLVDGVAEPASGRGRLLTGAPENRSTADLQVRVSLTPGQVTSGPEADLTLTRGVGARLDRLIGRMLDSQSGLFTSVTRRFDDTIDSLQQSIDRQQASFDRQQEALAKKFQAMEAAIAQLQSSANLLSAQLASLTGLRSGSTSQS
jgi:flagellar hook-associated protein 2